MDIDYMYVLLAFGALRKSLIHRSHDRGGCRAGRMIERRARVARGWAVGPEEALEEG